MIIRGPFNLTWRGDTLEDIEAIDIDYDINSEDYEANSGHVYEIDKSIKASIRLTFLATDVTSLSAVLPQYFVAEEGELADGSFLSDDRTAIDVIADECDTEPEYGDLIIVACGAPEDSFKLMHARTVIDTIEIGKIRKIVVKFIGESEAGQSILQIIGGPGAPVDPSEEDLFLLGDGDLFILGDGSNLVL